MYQKRFKPKVIFALMVSLWSLNAYSMSLEEYLNLVKKDNLTFKANSEYVEGAKLLLSEADLYYTPEFFVDATYRDSEQPQNPPFYRAIKNKNISLGISQNFKFGLEAKLYYEAMGFDMIGTPSMPGFNIMAEYWDTAPKLDLRMPLLSGGFGRRIRAQEEILRKQVVAEQQNAAAQTAQILANAEAYYWKLALWQEVISIQEQALKAAENILSHLSKKRKMNLTDDSDVIQAKALVEKNRLELKRTNDESRATLRAFNRLANRDANQTVDQLEKVDYSRLESFEIPEKRPGDRADVLALQAQADLTMANAKLARERGKPTLDIFGQIAMHGQRPGFSDSLDQSFNGVYNTNMIGLNLKVPLFFGSLSNLETGALKAQYAAQFNKEAAEFNQEQEWINLVESLKDIRENLKMLTELEAIQKTKLDIERRRFREGKTTTFQVLLFEQEYSNASATKVRLASDILGLLTQIQLYQPVKGN